MNTRTHIHDTYINIIYISKHTFCMNKCKGASQAID